MVVDVASAVITPIKHHHMGNHFLYRYIIDSIQFSGFIGEAGYSVETVGLSSGIYTNLYAVSIFIQYRIRIG